MEPRRIPGFSCQLGLYWRVLSDTVSQRDPRRHAQRRPAPVLVATDLGIDESVFLAEIGTRGALGEGDRDVESGRQQWAERPKSPSRLSRLSTRAISQAAPTPRRPSRRCVGTTRRQVRVSDPAACGHRLTRLLPQRRGEHTADRRDETGDEDLEVALTASNQVPSSARGRSFRLVTSPGGTVRDSTGGAPQVVQPARVDGGVDVVDSPIADAHFDNGG